MDLFVSLYPSHRQPAFSPWRLAFVTMRPWAKGLSDRQAANTFRSQIDWKYVLRLNLTDTGFDASALSAFRPRLVRTRYIGRANVGLGLYRLMGRGFHMLRLDEWFLETERPKTRVALFARLIAEAAPVQ